MVEGELKKQLSDSDEVVWVHTDYVKKIIDLAKKDFPNYDDSIKNPIDCQIKWNREVVNWVKKWFGDSS